MTKEVEGREPSILLVTMETNLPMDGAVGVALVSMFVSFSMSLFGLLRKVKPAKRRMERNHD